MLSGFAVPKWHELGVRPSVDTTGYILHCKDIPFLSQERLLELPVEDPHLRESLRRLLGWTNDAGRYECAATEELETATLSMADINLQLQRRKIRRQHANLGTCKPLRTPEHAKKRWRPLQWPKLANQVTSRHSNVDFTPYQKRHAAILKGAWTIDLDWSAFYDQFELSPEVSQYFSFRARDSRVYSMCVLPMGLKHSVSVAHTATLVLLDFGPSCYCEAYIDNVRLVDDDKECVVEDAAKLACRCAAAGVTVNEIDVTQLQGLSGELMMVRARELVRPLLKQKGEWLGESYDYEKKLLDIAPKTREKVASCMSAKRPTFRTFAAAAGILQYASRTLGIQLAKYYAARRAISAVAWLLEGHVHLWDVELPEFCPSVLQSFRSWQLGVLRAKPRLVTEGEPPSLVIIVDASDSGWGAIAIDDMGRDLFHGSEWTTSDRRCFDTKLSVRAEPEGIYRACCRFIRWGRDKVVHIATDSMASKGAVSKGQSLSYWMNHVCWRLQSTFPGVTFTIQHIAGATNPADAISRGAPRPSLEELEAALDIADRARELRGEWASR